MPFVRDTFLHMYEVYYSIIKLRGNYTVNPQLGLELKMEHLFSIWCQDSSKPFSCFTLVRTFA